MTVEVAGGVEPTPPPGRLPQSHDAAAGAGPVRARPGSPARVLFFVPLAVMFVFSLWRRTRTSTSCRSGPSTTTPLLRDPAYVRTLGKTVVMGAAVTALCLVIAFAVAYFLARYVSRRWARLALLVIIVPFWSSYLLRVYSWQAILGEKGALNQLLMALGLIAEPSRLFVYNDIGTFIVLTYVYLPFAIAGPVRLARTLRLHPADGRPGPRRQPDPGRSATSCCRRSGLASSRPRSSSSSRSSASS